MFTIDFATPDTFPHFHIIKRLMANLLSDIMVYILAGGFHVKDLLDEFIRFRNHSGKTLREISEESGLSIRTVKGLANRELTNPGFKTVLKVHNYLEQQKKVA